MKKSLLQCIKSKLSDYSEKEIYAMILCGEIRYGGEVLKNPNEKVNEGRTLEILRDRYVSRGGEKLKGLIDQWKLHFKGKVVLDAGSSTGGFTDCLLQEGADRVFAVDVGYNQLDYKLRMDPRVVVMEKTNIMAVEGLIPLPHMAVADLSFRSITGAACHIINQTSDKILYALVKPQFEKDKSDDFTGIVESSEDRLDILNAVLQQLQKEQLGIRRATPSQVKGRKGNQEYFFEIVPAVVAPSKSEQEEMIKTCTSIQ